MRAPICEATAANHARDEDMQSLLYFLTWGQASRKGNCQVKRFMRQQKRVAACFKRLITGIDNQDGRKNTKGENKDEEQEEWRHWHCLAGLIGNNNGQRLWGRRSEEPTEGKAAKIRRRLYDNQLGDNNFNDMVNGGYGKAKAELNISYDYSGRAEFRR